MSSMTDPHWSWGVAWCKLREDVNLLAWLHEEERQVMRLYVESVFWALTGKRFTVEEFTRELGIVAADPVPPDDPELPAQGALD